ncbi:MAG: radical SAM protein [Deltaproteobacteria bacterium]|nr:radical SAM protein [Deltaproteobacteria bacterium]
MTLPTIPRLVKAFAPTWISRPRGPVRAVVAMTRRCNLKCDTCRTWSFPRGKEMTPDEVARLFTAMPDLAWLDLTGGEPFLRKDVVDVFRAVLSATPSLAVLHFPTNGWYRKRALECALLVREKRPDVTLLVTVSVDGPQAIHDRIRGREGSFDRAMETLREMRRIPGVQSYVGTTVGPENRGFLTDLRAALTSELPGFDDRWWHWNLVQESGHFFANEGIETLSGPQASSLVREQLARRGPPLSPVDLMEWMYLVNVHAVLQGDPLRLDCRALHSSCFVSSDAVLYPCHVWDRPLADLRDRGFRMDEVWALDAVQEARQAVRRLDCGGCFTPCEAYTTLAGAPLRSLVLSATRAVGLP